MKKTFCYLIFSISTVCLTGCRPEQAVEKDYAQYVNTFIGGAANGHTFPGACVPFGLVQVSPVTGAIGWGYCSEYMDTDSVVWGFTQTHLNGTGCMDLGDILIMPITENRIRSWNTYRSSFSKSNERAVPGYYTVELDNPKVKAELTATTHVALHRYTFHHADSASILIDLQHGPAWNEDIYHSQVDLCHTQWEDAQTLTGHVKNTVWVEQDYFFVLKFDRPVTNRLFLPRAAEKEKGQRIIASFDLKAEEALLVKIGLSTTGIAGAKKNMETELADWDFDAVRRTAYDTWNAYLSRVDVKGTKEEKINYYTSLYHALIQPNEISDVDGFYRNSADSVVRSARGKSYSTFSCWDTYRAANSLYTLLTPEVVDDFINSLVEHGEVQGFLPVWELWGKDNYCMVGNHAVPMVAEAYAKGFRGFDAEKAFAVIEHGQTVSHPLKSNWEIYMKYGYFPCDLIDSESVSSTLENVYDDYAASDMAKRLGKTKEAEYFAKRAEFYKNLFDNGTNFMRPRLSDGNWTVPFDPMRAGGNTGYTEGNAWQYTWHVQHDVPGLIKLFGGPEKFTAKIDSMLLLELKTDVVDISGLIGQYAHGNEPCHHVAYLYALAGQPKKTQELIRRIFDTQYSPRPDGLCGNDDCGQMSAWYMFSAMGFYPVDPVSCKYVFGAPQLPKIVLHLQDGKTFTVIAKNLSKENKYVESVRLNGKPYAENCITHEDIINGGTLVFNMYAGK